MVNSFAYLLSVQPLVKCLFFFFFVGGGHFLIVFLLLNSEGSFCILGTNSLWGTWVSHISPTVSCLFILFTGSFAEQKFLILTRANLPVFPVTCHMCQVFFFFFKPPDYSIISRYFAIILSLTQNIKLIIFNFLVDSQI